MGKTRRQAAQPRSHDGARGGQRCRRSARTATVQARLRTSTRLARSQLRQEVKAALAVAPEDRSAVQQDLLATHQALADKILEEKDKYAQEKERRAVRRDDPAVIRQHADRLFRSMMRPGAHVVVYTGAGISTAANIPDYRGPKGLWSRMQRGERTESILRDLPDLARCTPTYTHMALARLVALGVVQFIVSQNCDGLHLRSGVPASHLAEVHGNCFIEVCPRCHQVYRRCFDVTHKSRTRRHTTDRTCAICTVVAPPSPSSNTTSSSSTTNIISASRVASSRTTSDGAACASSPDVTSTSLPPPAPPRSPPHLEDTIVHFGEATRYEAVANWAAAAHHAARATCIVVLGSSLKVLKAYACLWKRVRAGTCELFIVNNQWTHMDRWAAQKTHADTDAFMRALVNLHDGTAQDGNEVEETEDADNDKAKEEASEVKVATAQSQPKGDTAARSGEAMGTQSLVVKVEAAGSGEETGSDGSGQRNGRSSWAPHVYDEANDPFWRSCDTIASEEEQVNAPGGWLLAGIKGARRK